MRLRKTAAGLLACLLVFLIVQCDADELISNTKGPIESYRDKLKVTSDVSIIAVGSTVMLTVTEGFWNLKWSSNNPEIATVDRNGEVTGIADGTVRITVTADGYSDSIMLQVVGESLSGKKNKSGKTLIIINGSKEKIIYDGKRHSTTYMAASNSDAFDASLLHLNNEDHLASGTDCGVYTGSLSAEDFTYDGEGETEYVISNGWLQIKPVPVTVKADDLTKWEGDPDPEFTATVTGLPNGEEPDIISYSFIVTTEGETASIIPVCDQIQGNYRVNALNGKLTVIPAIDAELFNVAEIGDKQYRLAKTRIRTTITDTAQNGGRVLDEDEYRTDPYDFNDLVIELDGKTYCYASQDKTGAPAGNHENFYTVTIKDVSVTQGRIGGEDGWLIPEDQRYTEMNNTNGFRRCYLITLNENGAGY